MKSIFVGLLFMMNICWAQKNIIYNETYQQVVVENVPKEKLPKLATNLMFVKSYEDTARVYYFGYIIKDDNFRVIAKFTQDEEWLNIAKSYSYFTNDTIYLQSEQPFRATINEYYFLWEKNKIIFLKSETSDPSWEAVDRAEKALSEGKIQEAIDNYYQVMYPMSYINEDEVGFNILSKASELALTCSQNKKYANAALYIDTAMGYYNLLSFTEPNDELSLDATFEDHYITQYKDSFGLWMANYGYYLYKADSLEKSITINSQLNNTYPLLSGPYLQHADALYDLNKKTQAKPLYQKYIRLMTDKGKEKNIPERVKERIN